MSKGIHYCAVGEIQQTNWLIQGSVYERLADAKFAALKLYCNTTGVIVKRYSRGGFALFYWRRNTLAA